MDLFCVVLVCKTLVEVKQSKAGLPADMPAEALAKVGALIKNKSLW